MAILVNRAKMTTATTGTGTITLGSASSGYQTFAAAGVANGDTVRYVIEDGTAWEIGSGTYTSAGTTLTRTPSESSSGGAAITLSGNAIVYVTAAAADLASPGANSDITSLSGLTTALSVIQGGTGQVTATAAFDALSPTTTLGDIVVRGSVSNARLPIGSSSYTLASNGTTASWQPDSVSGTFVVIGANGMSSGYNSLQAAIAAISTLYPSPTFFQPVEIHLYTRSITLTTTTTIPQHVSIQARNCRVRYTGTGPVFNLSGFNRIYGLEFCGGNASNNDYCFNCGNNTDISIIECHLYGNDTDNFMKFISASGDSWARINEEHCIINFRGFSGYAHSFVNTGTVGRFCDTWLNDVFSDAYQTLTGFGGNVDVSGGCADIRIERSTIRGQSTFYTGVRLGTSGDKLTLWQCNLEGAPYITQTGLDIYVAPGATVYYAYTNTSAKLINGTAVALLW